MRIRTIKPEFWEHPVMGRQSDATKLLAIGLLNVADDEGYFYADPKAVRNLIRPQDDDSRITTVSLRDLSEIGYISIRNHPTHGDVGKIESFTSHQVINKPKSSKIKELYEYGIDTVLIPDEYRLERKGKEGNGKDLLSENGHEEKPIGYPEIVEKIWAIAPTKSRDRSSKKKVSEVWQKTKPKPDEESLLANLSAWAVCEDWTKDGGQFAPGIHIWLKDRKWEAEPPAKEHRKAIYESTSRRGLWD